MCLFAIWSSYDMLIIGVVVLLLFGNRLPSVMRSLGQGVTEFKKGLEGGPDSDSAKSGEPAKRLDADTAMHSEPVKKFDDQVVKRADLQS